MFFNASHQIIFRAISKLMPNASDERDSLISEAFRLCVRDGQCDGKCLFHMRSAATPQLVSELLGCSDPLEAGCLTVRELPFRWTCNVKQSKDQFAK